MDAKRNFVQRWSWWQCALLLLSVLGLLSVAACAGGPNLTGDELPGIGGNDPGDGKHPFAFSPPVESPETETYLSNAPNGASLEQRWLVNSYLPLPGGVYQNASLGDWVDLIFSEINSARSAQGLRPVQLEPHLSRIAQAHAREMALRAYFNHDTPEGLEPWDRMAAADIPPYGLAAENIAKGQESAQEVVEGWLNSPGHRANLLHPDVTHIGIGLYFDDANYNDPIHCVADLVEFSRDPSEGDYWTPEILTP